MKPNAEAAIEAVRALAEGPMVVAVVGSLSTRVSKGLKLKPGEPRLV
jgi:spore germination protein GerM